MKISVFFIVTAIILSGCTRLSDHGFDRIKLSVDANKGGSIRLADYSPFVWDHVHIFGPYTPATVMKEEVGRSVPFPHVESEGYCLLVFLSRNKIAAAFEVAGKPVDFAGLIRKGGYSREEAIFTVAIRGSDSWRYLKKNEANPSSAAQRP